MTALAQGRAPKRLRAYLEELYAEGHLLSTHMETLREYLREIEHLQEVAARTPGACEPEAVQTPEGKA